MADKKTIYLRPGQMLDIRFVVHEDDELNARDWNAQARPYNMLARYWPNRIAPADIAVELDRRPEAWKE